MEVLDEGLIPEGKVLYQQAPLGLSQIQNGTLKQETQNKKIASVMLNHPNLEKIRKMLFIDRSMKDLIKQ